MRLTEILNDMESHNNKTGLIIDLQNRGYDQDFILANEGILNIQNEELLPPEEFEITETHQFSGLSGPKDNFIIYGIMSVHSDIKGILITSYARLLDGVSIHLWSKLSRTIQVDAEAMTDI